MLRGVMDPELHDNIVDLGMVRSAWLEGSVAHITIALTTAGCPLRATIKRDCESRVGSLPGVERVQLHWDELNAEEKARVMERARQNARNNATDTAVPLNARVLAVASGKGGVGKTTVAAAIAVALAQRGHPVHLTTTDPAGFSSGRTRTTLSSGS